MAVYAPIPFCITLDELSKTPPDQRPPDQISISSAFPDKTTGIDYSKITDSGPIITKLLSAWVKTHQPTVAVSDSPRSVIVPDIL
jgi:hypothetical protein